MERYAKLGLIYGTVRRAQMHTRIRKYIRLSNRHNHDYSSMEIIREEEETLNGLGASYRLAISETLPYANRSVNLTVDYFRSFLRTLCKRYTADITNGFDSIAPPRSLYRSPYRSRSRLSTQTSSFREISSTLKDSFEFTNMIDDDTRTDP